MLHYSNRTLTEPDEFREIVSAIELSVDFQQRQVLPSRVEQYQSTEWAVDFGEVNVKTCLRGTLPVGWASMCLALNEVEARYNGHQVGPEHLCCLPPGAELDGSTLPGYVWMTVAMPLAHWARSRALAGMADDDWPPFSVVRLPGFAGTRAAVGRIRQVLRAAAAGKASAAAARRDAASLVTHLSIVACEQLGKADQARVSLRNRARLARRAAAWMHEHLREPVGVPDICDALRVSRRELEYAFRSVFDESPRDFLHSLRLNAVRNALLRGGGGRSVLEIALDHGITHAGRFAAHYRERFGERPSETRARC